MKDAAILIVDDEQAILHMLKTVLLKENFTRIDTAASGEAAIAACEQQVYDLILLDIMLPGQSGLEICPFIRRTTNAPILFLTARTTDFDKLTGFAVGGDDYITKPFNPLEVVARIKAQLRRYLKQEALPQNRQLPEQQPVIYRFGRFTVNESAGELYVEGSLVPCPALVFQLLVFFCKHPQRIFTKSELYEKVWGGEALGEDNTVMVHIHRIRERIELDPSNPKYLVNVRGLGYKLIPQEEQQFS